MKGIITLCGSTRFYKEFDRICYELTVADYGIFTIGTMLNSDKKLFQSQEVLDRFVSLHREKIRRSNAIFVVDVEGYIGEQTRDEIQAAKDNQLPVFYLSKGHLQYLKSIDNLHHADLKHHEMAQQTFTQDGSTKT